MKLNRECLHPNEIPPDVPITPIGQVKSTRQKVSDAIALLGALAIIGTMVSMIFACFYIAGRTDGWEERSQTLWPIARESTIQDCHIYGLQNNCEKPYDGYLKGDDETW